MQEDRARAEALLFFNGKRDFLDEDEATYASEDVDPAVQELVDSVQEQLPLLQKQASQLSDGIEVCTVYADVTMHYSCCDSVLLRCMTFSYRMLASGVKSAYYSVSACT